MATSASPASLDDRLVQTALGLLDREGLEALSLRRIARDSGVSHGAPLRHFRSHADLLAAVAARGFLLLSAGVEASGSGLPPDARPMDRLAAAGAAYAAMAVDHPGLFALMFRPDRYDRSNAALRRAADAAFEALVHHVRSAQAAGFHPDRDTRVLAGAVWATVHGLASLWAQGAFSAAVPGASFDDALTTTLELVTGHRQGEADG
jgi:AcrR family transcriptional regulator